MDKPILYRVYTTDQDIRNIDKLSLRHRLCTALINDDKAAFMLLIKDPGFGKLGRFSHTVASIFTYDHLDIAMAVLDGETRGLIDTEDVFKDGMTPLHLAVIRCAPKLTKYFLLNGGRVDAVSDNKKFNLEHATPIDCATNFIEPTIKHNVFNLLFWLCFHERRRLETIRLFAVQSEQQHTWAKEAFLNYAQNRELRKLAALFLAAPELCWPLLSNLKNKLNLLVCKTRIENQLSLLLDVFALVGHKLAAYIRLEEFTPKKHKCSTSEEIMQTKLAVECFICEAAIKKHGDTYADYYLRFFEADPLYDDGKGNPGCYKDSDEEWYHLTPLLKEDQIYHLLPYMVQKFTGSKRLEIPRLIPTLQGQNPGRAGSLTRDIEALALHNREFVSEFLKTREGGIHNRPGGRERGRGCGDRAVVIVSEIQRDSAGRGNWGMTNDDIAQEVEEPSAEIVVNQSYLFREVEESSAEILMIIAVEKLVGVEDPEEKSVSFNKFLKLRHRLIQKRRRGRGNRGGYARNNVSAPVIEDKSQFPPLGLLKVETTNVIGEIQHDGAGRGNWGMTNDDIAQEVEEPVAENEVNVAAAKPAGEEENVYAEKEATVNKAEEDPKEKSVSINEFLKPVGGERRDIRRQKRSRRGNRGGYARNNVSAPVIEDKSQVPPLGLLKVETTNVIGSEIQRDGAGSGNWGMTNDDIAQEVEEPVAENEVNVAAEKPGGEEENVDAEKEATVNKAEEDPEEKSVSINEFLKPVGGERRDIRRQKRRSRRGNRGGYV